MKRNKTTTSFLATLVLLMAGLFFSQNSFAAGQIMVTWPENTETNIVSYKVFYSTTSGSYSNYVSVTPANACANNTCQYLLGGLTEDTTYYFTVKAVDNNGFESVHYAPEGSEYIQNQYGVGTVTVSQLVSGQASGDYSIHINADGTYTLNFVSNGAPSVTISLDQTEYIEGGYATITPNGADPEGDAITYVCYADGIALVGFTTNNLSVGTHNVYCEANDGINSTPSDSILVTVLDGPHIGLPVSITLTAEVGDASVSQNFTVDNQGYGNMGWEITTTSGMLSFSEVSGTNDTVVTVTADTSTLGEGTYYGDIVVTSSDVDNSPETISVEVHVVYYTNNTASRDLEYSNAQYVYITDGNQTGLDIGANGTDFTVETWRKFETTVAASNQAVQTVFAKAGANGNWGVASYIQNFGGNDIWIIDMSSDGNSYSNLGINTGLTFQVGIWYHFATSYHASAGSIEFFINGSSIGTVTGFPTSVYNNTANFELGHWSGNATWYDGLIDDSRIWNVARTAAEIADNYNSELLGNEQGLVAYWRFNNDALDATSNNNDLSSNGSAVYSTDTPTEH